MAFSKNVQTSVQENKDYKDLGNYDNSKKKKNTNTTPTLGPKKRKIYE